MVDQQDKVMAEMNDELLIKFLLKETTPQEDMLVKDWLAASPANKSYLAQFETIWAVSKNLASESSIDENEAWAKFKQRSAGISPERAIAEPIAARFQWLKIAAVLFIAIGAWAAYSYLHTDYTTLSTDQQVLVETLPDGSEITLNKNSVLSYPERFAGNKRSVNLKQGEVFFKVAHDKSKPFVIHADDVDVTVVGTAFNVNHQKEHIEVIVETGIVRVSRGDENVVLRAGDKVRINDKGSKLIKEKSTDMLYTYYRSKEFVANSTPLWRMVEILNEAYSADIIIADEKLKNLRLTATFKDQPVDTILLIISQALDIKVEKSEGRFILRPAK